MYLDGHNAHYPRKSSALRRVLRWLIPLLVVGLIALIVFVAVRYPKTPEPGVYQNVAQLATSDPQTAFTQQLSARMDQSPLNRSAGFAAPNFDASGWVLVDVNSGQVLASDHINTRIPPASLTKMMTVALVFKAIQEGKISLKQEVTVSKKAWRTGGSRMFIEAGKQVSIEDLIQGLVIQSGNDAAVQLAETVGGSTEDFVAMMNTQAKAWGLKNTHFSDPNGLPMSDHYSSVRDLAIIAQHLIHDWPQFYHYFGEGAFTYNRITQSNRNSLVRRNVGVDGIKTGHTKAAGYCLVASSFRDGRRLLTVVVGTKSSRARESISLDLLNWGYNNFSDKVALTQGQVLTDLPIYYGKQHHIQVGVLDQVVVTAPISRKDAVQVRYHYNTQLQAPIRRGDIVGQVEVLVSDEVVRTLPLVSLDTVERAGAMRIFWANVKAAF